MELLETACLLLLALGTASHALNVALALGGSAAPYAVVSVQLALRVAISVAFVGWFTHRYARHWETSGRRGLHPAWSVAGFLLPGLNLALPFVLARRMWRRATDRGPALVRLWWSAFVTGNVLWTLSKWGLGSDGVVALREGCWAASGALSILLVRCLAVRSSPRVSAPAPRPGAALPREKPEVPRAIGAT